MRRRTSGVVFALSTLTRGDKALFKHPKIRRIIGVGSSDLMQLAFSALTQAQYGNLPVTFYKSVEEAYASLTEKPMPV